MKNIMPVFTRIFFIGFLMGCISACSANECVEVILGSVTLSIPKQHMTPTTPRRSTSGNFIFLFDSSVPGVDCADWCKDLFVNISSISSSPEQQWKNLSPKFTGRRNGNYNVYLSRFDQGSSKPLREILVPSDAIRPEEEFYSCVPNDRVLSPHCEINVVTKNGLTAKFSIQRKSLIKARVAANFIKASIDQFSENNIKGICK
jgi:hypothetical protein